jgi:hypothetical protein
MAYVPQQRLRRTYNVQIKASSVIGQLGNKGEVYEQDWNRFQIVYQFASADRVSGTLSTSCSYSTSTRGPPGACGVNR